AAKVLARAASGTPRNGLAGASAGAGTCNAPRDPPTAGGGARRVEGTGGSRGHARQVRHHAPGVRVAAGGCPGPFRIRDGQGQPGGELGQPALFVLDDLRAQSAAGQPRPRAVPDPVQLVVPAVREELHGQAREVRVLISEQPPHQIRLHVDLGGWHPVHSHNGRQRQANTGCSKWATRVTRPCSASWQNWWMTAAVGAYTWPPSSASRRTGAGDSGMRRS